MEKNAQTKTRGYLAFSRKPVRTRQKLLKYSLPQDIHMDTGIEKSSDFISKKNRATFDLYRKNKRDCALPGHKIEAMHHRLVMSTSSSESATEMPKRCLRASCMDRHVRGFFPSFLKVKALAGPLSTNGRAYIPPHYLLRLIAHLFCMLMQTPRFLSQLEEEDPVRSIPFPTFRYHDDIFLSSGKNLK